MFVSGAAILALIVVLMWPHRTAAQPRSELDPAANDHAGTNSSRLPAEANQPTSQGGSARTAAVLNPVPSVRLIGPRLIAVTEGSPFRQQLTTLKLQPTMLTMPMLNVSGVILARISPGETTLEDRWQFSNIELSTDYADWLRSKNEIEFAESQLKKTRELITAETAYRQQVVDHLEPLFKQGSTAEKTVRQAEADLLRTQIEGEKSLFQAEATLRTAKNSKIALERSLSQAGVEPVVFGREVENMVLVSVNVPESRISQVSEGQACEVRFYAFPDRTFPGHVEALGSALLGDRRTLRVLFDLNDREHILRPGMFGDVGLGTEPRNVIVIPTQALLHVGSREYVLVAEGPGWRVQEVVVGEVRHDSAELIKGLKAGDQIITDGAILMKPAVMQALAAEGQVRQP